jgi:hypothetical protein
MEIRKELINSLLRRFLADLQETTKPFSQVNDFIYLIENLKEYLVGIYSVSPANDLFNAVEFDEDEFLRTKLLSKFRDKMLPFVKLSMKHYFAKDEFNKGQLFKKLNISEPTLNDEEFDNYIISIDGLLSIWLEKLYLLPENANAENLGDLPKLSEQKIQKHIKHPDYTRNRQILLFYYLTQTAGIDKRTTVSMRKLAQFAHYLFYQPHDNIDNSEIYLKIKSAPFLNHETYLIKDLEFAKNQFAAIEHHAAVELIEKEIRGLKKK